MEKLLVDELKENLEKNVAEEKEKLQEAFENKEIPTMQKSPAEVAKEVKDIIDNHEFTSEELCAVAGVRGMTKDEMIAAKKWGK